MSLARPTRARPAKRGEAMILFAVAHYTFAISAAAVDEIRDAVAMKPFAPSPRFRVPTVLHTLTRDSRTAFVVNANMHLRLLPSPITRVLLLRNAPIGLAVGETHRMTEISLLYALPRAFTGEERSWYRGLALIDDNVVPVINPAVLLDNAQLERLQVEYSVVIAKGATA
jgi:chemotaxis signal transduction protein